jgi:hypothetical protein
MSHKKTQWHSSTVQLRKETRCSAVPARVAAVSRDKINREDPFQTRVHGEKEENTIPDTSHI